MSIPRKKCKVENCGRHLYSRKTNLCGMHYKRLLRNGSLDRLVGDHGKSDTTEYKIWENIVQRCYNAKVPSYGDYGGRGITMSDEWRKSFMAFFSDMGYRPSKSHTIERINNDDGYNKQNCRWATYTEQSFNKRMPLNNKSGFLGVSYDTTRMKWKASLKSNGKIVFQKRYSSKEEAIQARIEAEIKYWGKSKTPLPRGDA